MLAVVQYMENSGIIAVNYKAREMGVSRHMRQDEAKKVCPDLVCVKVPSHFNKADISKYRAAGKLVADVFEKFTNNLERASIDEAYLDITDLVNSRLKELVLKKYDLTARDLVNTFAVGYEKLGGFVYEVSKSINTDFNNISDPETRSFEISKLRLLVGASIVSDIRRAVKEETDYTCSAGIAHNKILAKLVCSWNKPNKQTILPIESIPLVFETLEISKIKSMGGKTGEDVCSKLKAKFMGDLLPFEEGELQDKFGVRIGSFLYLMARGIDLECVVRKVNAKSIAVSKNFRGKNEIFNTNTLKYWIKEMSKELKQRLDIEYTDTDRVAKQMTVQYKQFIDNKDVMSSRTVQLNGKNLNSYSLDEIAVEAFNTIERTSAKFLRIQGKCILNYNIKLLGLSAGKFEESIVEATSKIQNMFKNYEKNSTQVAKAGDSGAKAKKTSLKQVAEATSRFFKKKSNFDVLNNEVEAKSSEESLLNDDCLDTRTSDVDFYGENDEEIYENEDERELCAHIEFTRLTLIAGVGTLKHWILVLLNELNDKIKTITDEENLIPRKIKLLWKQLIDNKEKICAEEIPFDVFTQNSIDAQFIIDVMNDSSSEFFVGDSLSPISSLEIKSYDFVEGTEWKIEIGNDNQDESVKFTVSNESDDGIISSSDSEEEITDENFLEETIIEETPPSIQTSDILQNSSQNDEDKNILNALTKQVSFQESDSSYPPFYTQKPNVTVFDENENDENLLTDFDSCPKFDSQFDDDEQPESEQFEQCQKDEENNELISTKSHKNSSQEQQAGTSYKQTYAEFKHTEMFDKLNPPQECLECGKMIRKFDMLTHVDGHIAMKLSNEQREEFRAEQKKKYSTPGSTKKVPKVKTSSSSKLTTMQSFVSKTSVVDESDANKIQCDECNKMIESNEFMLHQDYHLAQKLRWEQFRENSGVIPAVKRKSRPSNSEPKSKNLKTYFSNE